MKEDDLENRAFNELFKRASQPEPPHGAEQRAMMRIRLAAAPASGNIVVLRRPPGKLFGKFMAAALPLAASIVLGIIIGSEGTLDIMLPESIASLAQSTELDFGLPSLLGDADSLDGDLA